MNTDYFIDVIRSNDHQKIRSFIATLNISEIRDPKHKNLLGVAYIALKEIDQARENFVSAIDLDGSKIKYRKNLYKTLNSESLFLDHYKALISSIDAHADYTFFKDLFFRFIELQMSSTAVRVGKELLKVKIEEEVALSLIIEAMAIGNNTFAHDLLNRLSYESIEDFQLKLLKFQEETTVAPEQYIDIFRENSSETEQRHLKFIVADKYWNSKEFKKSLEYYKSANSLVKTKLSFSNDIKFYESIVTSYDDCPTLENKMHFKPIFIVGMPRCGSTLLHQLLSSDEKFVGMGEASILGPLLGKLVLDDKLTEESLSEVRGEYIKSVALQAKKYERYNFSFSVDKSLFSFRVAGLIKKIFPDSIIINLSRDLCEHKLAIYRQNFNEKIQSNMFRTDTIDASFDFYSMFMNFWKSKNIDIVNIYHHDLISNTQQIMSNLKRIISVNELNTDNRSSIIPVKTASINTVWNDISNENNYDAVKPFIQKHEIDFRKNTKISEVISQGILAQTEKEFLTIVNSLPIHFLKIDLILLKSKQLNFNEHSLNKIIPRDSKKYLNDVQLNQTLILLLNKNLDIQASELVENYIMEGGLNIRILNNYSIALNRLGKYSYAVEIANKVLKIDPNNLNARINRVNSYIFSQQYNEISAEAKSLMNVYPNDPTVIFNVARIEHELGNWQTALRIYLRVINCDSHNHPTYAAMSAIYADIGDFENSMLYIDQAIELAPNNLAYQKAKLFRLNYIPTQEHQITVEALKQYCKKIFLIPENQSRVIQDPRSRKLKIGLVSADFRRHSARFFIRPFIRGLCSLGHEVHLYSNTKVKDSETELFQSSHDVAWFDIFGLHDEKVAELIQNHEIDILFDLSGHTAGNRLELFSMKPAPITASTIGFNSSTGLSNMDYFISDKIITPHDSTQYFSEKVIRLETFAHAFQPDENSLLCDQFDHLPSKNFVLNTNTRAIRLNDDVISMWAEILHLNKNAVLHINGQIEEGSEAVTIFKQRFDKYYPVSSRLKIFRKSPIYQSLRDVHLTLDPAPHSSGTTLFESLYAGVPFVTLAGSNSIGRLGASILHHTGLSEFIATSRGEYISNVTNFINKWDIYSDKKAIHDQFMTSNILDAELNAEAIIQAIINDFTD